MSCMVETCLVVDIIILKALIYSIQCEVYAPRAQTVHIRLFDKDDSKKDEKLGR